MSLNQIIFVNLDKLVLSVGQIEVLLGLKCQFTQTFAMTDNKLHCIGLLVNAIILLHRFPTFD